ncbi:MAG: helix-turn-helix transcriptional regulator [Clostridiales bacterium]|nr:helix-turn-helix transcriptional regulator [Clostridiales bacterium]
MPEQCARLIDELIELRKAKGWTQQELARACGLTQSVIGRIESKKSVPTLVTLQKIVAALDAILSVNQAG